MSTPRAPEPAKLVMSLLVKEKLLLHSLVPVLNNKFGEVDLVSSWLDFNYTDYYTPEMGEPLFRRIFSFRALIEQGTLADIKNFTNQVEKEFSDKGRRKVNIDPGYLLHAQFILATGKNYSHRVYIGQNIYADLTLMFRNGRFETLPWTYPDYADEPAIDVLQRIRKKYTMDIKQLSSGRSDI